MLKDLTKGNEAKTIIAQNKGANKLIEFSGHHLSRNNHNGFLQSYRP